MLKRNPEYVKREFAGIPYLIPYGQGIVDGVRNLRLNETGSEVWEFLEKERKREGFAEAFLEEYYPDAEGDFKKEMAEDISRFTDILISHEAVLDDTLSSRFCSAVRKEYKIADQRVCIHAPAQYIAEEFAAFEVQDDMEGVQALEKIEENPKGVSNGGEEQKKRKDSGKEPDLEVVLKLQESRQAEKGKLLIRNKELAVFEQNERYLFLFHQAENVTEAFLSKDGKRAEVYFELYHGKSLREEFFHVIRFFFLYMVQKKGYFALHSVSLLYQGKAWLFSGHSGAGKSTHTGFWEETLHTPILNGDLNLISIETEETGKDMALIYGLPWCGTSGIYDTGTYSLGGIILLKKAENGLKVRELSGAEKELLVSQRFVSPTWTEELQDKNLKFVKKLAKLLPVWKLDHIKDASSVEVIRREIEMHG